jgi:hypothetical protein
MMAVSAVLCTEGCMQGRPRVHVYGVGVCKCMRTVGRGGCVLTYMGLLGDSGVWTDGLLKQTTVEGQGVQAG